jgi:ankyrin repeat protein
MSVHKLIKTGVTFDAKKVISSSNINSRDQDGQTPLHIASFEGNLTLVRYLISKKVNIQNLFHKISEHKKQK